MSSAPPLLRLIERRKVRPRKAPTIRPKEVVLHTAVAKALRELCRNDWQWCHIPSGEKRDVKTACKLKQMGTKPGWPDFVLIPPTRQLHCLELKRQGEKLSEDQEFFRIWCVRHGVPHVVAYSLDEVLVALDAWQCLRIKIAG